MTTATDTVRDELAQVTATRPAGAADAVVGVEASHVCSPATADEVSQVLQLAARHQLVVVPRGAGTKMHWGSAPQGVDVVLDMTAMTGVVEHAAGDLVVVVRAGTPVQELQDTVASAGQQLALDSPLEGATVGGMLSTATSGPRRVLYGTARDLLIGVTFVRGDGVVAKAGGKVVKNVAGYDFGKLLTGAYGTLGVVTEAVFRLHPVPAARGIVQVRLPDAATAGRSALAVLGSQVVASAVELDLEPDGAATVQVLVEGVAAGVPARVDTVRRLLGGASQERSDLPEGFGRYPFGTDDTGLKLTSSMSGVGPLLSAAHDLAQRHDVQLRLRGSASGVLYGAVPSDTDPATAADVVAGLRATAQRYDGSVTVLSAPPGVREAVDLWGPVPGLHLMRRLKDELDPAHRLSPGRFVGGI